MVLVISLDTNNQTPMTRLAFTYNNHEYAALVREAFTDGERQFHVTIMNGDLEQQFYPNRVIREKECVTQLDRSNGEISDSSCALLKKAIINSIRRNLFLFSNTMLYPKAYK
jgi:hypothetical protein